MPNSVAPVTEEERESSREKAHQKTAGCRVNVMTHRKEASIFLSLVPMRSFSSALNCSLSPS